MIWFFISFTGWIGALLFRRTYWPVFILLLFIMSGFRYYVGSDFDDYVFLFQDSVAGKDVPVEKSYPIIANLLHDLGFNFQAQILFYAFFTFAFLYKGILQVTGDKASLGIIVLFLYVIFYFPSLSIMRQALAASISFYACYRYLHRGNISLFVSFVIAAAFIHLSSIIYLMCICFYFFRPPKIVYITLIVIAALLGLTMFGEVIKVISDITGFGYKGYSFSSMPIRSPIFFIFTGVLMFVFLYSLAVSGDRDYFILNVVFFILIARLLAIDYKPLNRVGASFSVFLPVFIHQVFFERMKEKSRIIVLIAVIPLLVLADTFRSKKDYSYYQYSINFCVYGKPCPISIVGDVPLEDLKIREELR